MGKDWDRIGARSLNPSMQANKAMAAGEARDEVEATGQLDMFG